MKFSRFILLSGRDVFSHLLLLTLVSGSICLSSCEDDMDRPMPSSHMSFTTEINSSWTPSTRSTTNADAPQGTVTALQGGSTSLYLHTLYTDSIAFPSLDSHCDTAILTRATPIKNDNMYESFGVSAYSYTDAWSESKTPNYFHNATANKSGSYYTLSSTYYWPGASYKMKFFAYAPKDNSQYVLSDRTQAGSLTIRVTIPEDVNKQEDLLVAKTDELSGNSNTAVPLIFNHALTAIRFVCGDDMQGGTVEKVTLKNVYSQGTYDMGRQSWNVQGTPKTTFSQVLNKSTAGAANDPLTTDAQTFMMVPQTLPDGAQLEIVFTDNSNNIKDILTADIGGTKWPIGKTVTYKVSSSSINWNYTLTVAGPSDFTYTGGTQQYRVTSYRENTQGRKEPAQWTTQYSTNNGQSWTDTKPGWLTGFTAFGEGSTSAQSYDATVSAQTRTPIALQNAPVKGSEYSPYNLANQTNGGPRNENTANCYIVSAPGYYSFPLVYGNAIKNGTTNTSAYKTSNTGGNILSNFINHTGQPISDPYIKKNTGCNPATAELVWQDARNLVTNIKYNNTDNGNISFKVDQSSIRQGNAVIAIKDGSNNVLWSWHIWVTDENINKPIEVTNYQKFKYRFMPVNLGWCDDDLTVYAERSCKVKFTAGNQSQEIIIKQVANLITSGRGNHPYYQWGRKDPFLPINGSDFSSKTWYDKNGSASTAEPATEDLGRGITSIKNWILKPGVVQGQYYGDDTYANLWSAANTVTTLNDNEVVKTIHDPSPVGFKLPPSNAFTGFTTTGKNTKESSQINGTWDSSLEGWNFYTDSSKNKTIFFPASGYRNWLGAMGLNNGLFGYCWSATPESRDCAYALEFTEWIMYPLYSQQRGQALGVRCSHE